MATRTKKMWAVCNPNGTLSAYDGAFSSRCVELYQTNKAAKLATDESSFYARGKPIRVTVTWDDGR